MRRGHSRAAMTPTDGDAYHEYFMEGRGYGFMLRIGDEED